MKHCETSYYAKDRPRLPNSSPRPKTTLMPMTRKNSSEKMREAPISLPDETTVVDASTTGTPAAVTTATTEKVGIGDATTATISEASDLVTTTTR